MTHATTLKLQIGAVLAALALVSFAILQVSQAAFTDTTDTQGSWAAGTVALSDDDGTGQVAFTNDTSMVPGDSDQACITVTYDGTAAASVKLYGATTSTDGDLGQYLDLTIDEVTIEGEATCADATVDDTLYTGTVSVNAGSFAEAHTDWASGLDSAFAPSSSGETQIYRITVTLQDDNSAQGLDTTTTFTWEAQNT